MREVLTGLLFLIIAAGIFGFGIMAIARMARGNTTPDTDAGAPEGATILRFNPERPSSR